MMTWSLFLSVLLLGFFFLLISAEMYWEVPVPDEMVEKFVNEHNKYRELHHVPPLQWEDEEFDELIGRNHWYPPGKRGIDDISINDVFTTEAYNPVAHWYSHMKFYPHAPPNEWVPSRNSTERVISRVNCDYVPRGNVPFRFKENIFKIDGTPWDVNNETYQDSHFKTNPINEEYYSTTKNYAGSSADGGSKTPIVSEDGEESSTPGSDITPIGSKDHEESSTPGSDITPIGSKDHEESSTPGGSGTPTGNKDREESSTPDGSRTPTGNEDREESSTPDGSRTPTGNEDRDELSTPGGSNTLNGSQDHEESSMSHGMYGLDFQIITLLCVILAIFM